ncbi:MAG TPA: hypothetical protein VLF09_08625, partial [Cellvibrio sp.]|nr:hypothetical protein [Cellvibrio sp.]
CIELMTIELQLSCNYVTHIFHIDDSHLNVAGGLYKEKNRNFVTEHGFSLKNQTFCTIFARITTKQL